MLQAYSFAGTTMTILVSGAETNGAFAVLHVIKPPGSSTPPHSHDRELELSYVLSGTLSGETEGRIETRSPGESLVLPPARPHRLFNASGETVREFLLCAPAIFDRFVAAAGSSVEPYAEPRPMTAEDRQRLVEAAPDFGVRLLRSAEPDGRGVTPTSPEPERVDVPGASVEVLTRLGPADQDLVLMRVVLEQGRVLPLDGHVDQTCLFIVEGAAEVQRDGFDWMTLQAGEAMYVPAGAGRAARNAGHAPAHILLVTTVRAARRRREA